MTEQEREARVRELMAQCNLTEIEAAERVDIESGESYGDVIVVGSDDPPSFQSVEDLDAD